MELIKINEDKTIDKTFKVIFVGSIGAGKTSLIRRISTDLFGVNYEATLELKLNSVYYKVKNGADERKIHLVLHDTPGDQQYVSITSKWYQDSHAAIIVFDLTNKDSWNDVTFYLNQVLATVPNVVIRLVGTKEDIYEKRCLEVDEIERYAKENDLKHLNVSSKTGDGIEELVKDLISGLLYTKKEKHGKISKQGDEVGCWIQRCCTLF
eukprot:TRINITY_DN2154_c0_g6_i1.p1 TRINITY_DN2154_c0_g6~~TRINITY_DN2154_c0_g6_i1.p1  ORF type:complete len:209 (-),score=52.50 TRINITY_DN2154_c0_g6_i1:107-733(-)